MGPQDIYLDNASTSFPKAAGVAEAMGRFVTDIGCNVARGSYGPAFEALDVVWETRERLCALLGHDDPRRVVFTANVTVSLNMLLKGLLKPGDHVLVSCLEHNAVMRPLTQLTSMGVAFDRIPLAGNGQLDLAAAQGLIGPRTRAICMTHASNVSGAVLPAAQVGHMARRHGLFFILDVAQTAGFLDLDREALGADALAFTGHKGLMGPQGVGGMALSRRLSDALEPLISGGTGSMSDSEAVPGVMPDRLEAGTPNLPGLFGLHAALGALMERGLAPLRRREIDLAQRLEAGLAGLPALRLLAPPWFDLDGEPLRTPIISADCLGRDNAEVSFRLADEHHILTRCGLHCAPSAHRAYGTFPGGTVRFAVSHSNTEDDIDAAIAAMTALLA